MQRSRQKSLNLRQGSWHAKISALRILEMSHNCRSVVEKNISLRVLGSKGERLRYQPTSRAYRHSSLQRVLGASYLARVGPDMLVAIVNFSVASADKKRPLETPHPALCLYRLPFAGIDYLTPPAPAALLLTRFG